MSTLNVDSYVISENTYVMQSKLVGNKYYTTIIDKKGTYDCPKSVTRVIRHSCRLAGISTERVRAQSRRFFQEGVHKLPLILAYAGNKPLIFFPIYSPRSPGNVWLNINAISNISTNHTETIITLVNGEEVVLPVQYQAFCGLYVRAYFYQRSLNKEFSRKSILTLN